MMGVGAWHCCLGFHTHLFEQDCIESAKLSAVVQEISHCDLAMSTGAADGLLFSAVLKSWHSLIVQATKFAGCTRRWRRGNPLQFITKHGHTVGQRESLQNNRKKGESFKAEPGVCVSHNAVLHSSGLTSADAAFWPADGAMGESSSLSESDPVAKILPNSPLIVLFCELCP